MVKPKLPTALPNHPPAQRTKVTKPPAPNDAEIKAQLRMPNERDEALDMTNDAPDPLMTQAAVDVARGVQDTSKAAELDRAYKKLKGRG